MLNSKIITLAAITLLSASAGGHADTQAAQRDALARENAELRAELGKTKLEVQVMKEDLERIRAFLAERDLDTKMADWQKQKAELAEERMRLRQERNRWQEERQKLLQQMSQKAERQAEAEEQIVEAARPDWDARYNMGLIKEDQTIVYVTTTLGGTLVDTYPSIDRENVMVRGTFQNKSTEAWRYTFEIRIADNDVDPRTNRRRIVGSWLYQTPLLGPNDIHEWEVKVPVSDVAYIDVVQIGNVKADRPAVQPMSDQQ